MAIHERIAGVVLAGGRSVRMTELSASSGDANAQLKPHRTLAGQRLIDRAATRLRPQVGCLLINANDDPAAYRHLGAKVVADLEAGYPGPLAGLVCAMDYLRRESPDIEMVSLVPCDAPFLPHNLVAALAEALAADDAQVACPRYEDFLQPTFSLWRTDLLPLVRHELTTLGRGGFKDILISLDCAVVDWPQAAPNPFFNINTPEQLAAAETMILDGTST